ncbi:hypothetical protein F5887DRAFT_985423 [Amanita rubescens]|nr:hypothetical protein F5887DRAFT_985423 [Amanita rubescens]
MHARPFLLALLPHRRYVLQTNTPTLVLAPTNRMPLFWCVSSHQPKKQEQSGLLDYPERLARRLTMPFDNWGGDSSSKR